MSLSAKRRPRAAVSRLAFVDAAPWDLRQTLMEEKTALGFYLSATCLAFTRGPGGIPAHPLVALTASEQRIWIAGIVASARVQMNAPRTHDGGDARRRQRAARDLRF